MKTEQDYSIQESLDNAVRELWRKFKFAYLNGIENGNQFDELNNLLNDACDIEYRFSSNFKFIGVKFCLECNNRYCYVNTQDLNIVARFGCLRSDRHCLSGDLCDYIDDYFKVNIPCFK